MLCGAVEYFWRLFVCASLDSVCTSKRCMAFLLKSNSIVKRGKKVNDSRLKIMHYRKPPVRISGSSRNVGILGLSCDNTTVLFDGSDFAFVVGAVVAG